jgi:hypothetical protein
MNERIQGESTASESQDRVTALVEQQTAISEVLAPLRTRRTTCSLSSTSSSIGLHVSVEPTYAPYVSSKKAAFVSWRREGIPF